MSEVSHSQFKTSKYDPSSKQFIELNKNIWFLLTSIHKINSKSKYNNTVTISETCAECSVGGLSVLG